MTFASPAPDNRALADRIATVIRSKSENAPRSKQTAIGPSEVGQECVRRTSYKLMGWDKTNTTTDPWAAINGTAIHAYLAEAFQADKGNWLIEHSVTIRQGLSGSVDLFDVDNGIVIDHKCVGATSMKRAKEQGPTRQQLVQMNLYGFGLERAGHTVSKIALAFYPFGGLLSSMYVWLGDYDRSIAEEALSRLDATKELLAMLDVEEHPDRWSLIPPTTSYLCSWCPYHKPFSTDLTVGCPGESA